MSQCPVCQAPVTADFGLVECDQCQAQLIVHMDGRVEHSSSGGSAAAPDADPFAETDPGISAPLNLGDILEDEIAGEAAAEPAAAVDAIDAIDEPAEDVLFGAATQLIPEGSSEVLAEEAQPESDDLTQALAPDDALADQFEPAAEPAPQPPLEPAEEYDPFADEPGGNSAPEAYSVAPKASDSSDLSDIAQFGNSEASGGRDGTLRYILYISGIDTSDVRMAFREALTDRKFLWDIDQILRGLKNGNVRIENISATKAHVLISRLRNMPVKVRWEQYAVHQT